MNLGAAVARNSKAIALAVLLLVVAGVLSYASLPRGLYPELAFPRVVVVATLPDATAPLVLRNVTRPLEEALAPVLGVQRVRSRTIRGAVEISLQFDPDSDMVVALQLVQAKLGEVRGELPPATTLVAERMTPTSFPVLTVSVEGALPPEQLRDVALYQVRPALSRVAGVGPISVTAGEVREVEVEIDPSRAEAAGLTADGIAAKLTESNSVTTVGRADVAYRRYAVVVTGVASSLAKLGEFVVGGSERAPVRLADVAKIEAGHADPRLWCARRAAPPRWSTWRGASAATSSRSTPGWKRRSTTCARRCRPAWCSRRCTSRRRSSARRRRRCATRSCSARCCRRS